MLDHFHIIKVKQEFVATPSGTVNTQGQLTQVIQGTSSIITHLKTK